MKKLICKYCIIRFQPYAETEEFANIGIVIYAPNSQQIEYKTLNSMQHGKITQFFKPLDKKIYFHTIQIINNELKRIQEMQKNSPSIDLFAELTRAREDIIRYSNTRVIYSDDPAKELQNLFEYYVQRSFTKEKGHEDKMIVQLKKLLTNNNLEKKFKDKIIGDEEKFSVRFPFVHSNNNKIIIKPIHFKHNDSSQLIEHGLSWLGKVNQLHRYGFLKPEEILFAYAPPVSTQGKLRDAFEDIYAQIQDAKITMVNIKEKKKITQFAVQ